MHERGFVRGTDLCDWVGWAAHQRASHRLESLGSGSVAQCAAHRLKILDYRSVTQSMSYSQNQASRQCDSNPGLNSRGCWCGFWRPGTQEQVKDVPAFTKTHSLFLWHLVHRLGVTHAEDGLPCMFLLHSSGDCPGKPVTDTAPSKTFPGV